MPNAQHKKVNVTVRSFTTGLSFRPLVQKKLEVLSKAGLSKEDFSAADTKTMKVSCSLTMPHINGSADLVSCTLFQYVCFIICQTSVKYVSRHDERNYHYSLLFYIIIHTLCIKKTTCVMNRGPLHASYTYFYIGSNMTT